MKLRRSKGVAIIKRLRYNKYCNYSRTNTTKLHNDNKRVGPAWYSMKLAVHEIRTELFDIQSSLKRNKISAKPILALAFTCFPGFDGILNLAKLVCCLIDSKNIYHNCGPVNQTVSEPHVTDLTLGKCKARPLLKL